MGCLRGTDEGLSVLGARLPERRHLLRVLRVVRIPARRCLAAALVVAASLLAACAPVKPPRQCPPGWQGDPTVKCEPVPGNRE
jgi:hypothetical protein